MLLRKKPLTIKLLRLTASDLQDPIATCPSIQETTRKFVSYHNPFFRFGGLEGEMYDDDEIELNSQGRSIIINSTS